MKNLELQFLFSKDTGEEGDMFIKNESIAPIKVSFTNNLIKIILNYFLLEYQENLFENRKGSEFIIDFVDKTYYSCLKITL